MHLFVGGTFDRLHRGHVFLLEEAIKRSTRLTIGITTDAFLQLHKPQDIHAIQPFEQRKEQIVSWLQDHHPSCIVEIIPIDDPYEPAASLPDIDGLIVTEQNKKTGKDINQKRKERNLPELVLIEIPLVPAFDGDAISSTRIRSGDIDRWGNLYLPDSLRSVLRKPLGPIVHPQDLQQLDIIITVGDVTTDVVLQNGILPRLSIIDLHAQRTPYKPFEAFGFPAEYELQHVSSGPGYISDDAMAMIAEWSTKQRPTVLLVKGEDDLLVLPALIFAPLNACLLYGQPHEGMVKIEITHQIKNVAQSLMEQFKKTKI